MISRRDLLKLSSFAALASPVPGLVRGLGAPDYKIDIAPTTLVLTPRHRLKTTAYNGHAPGPLLRLKETQPVTIEVANHAGRPEVARWRPGWKPTRSGAGWQPIPTDRKWSIGTASLMLRTSTGPRKREPRRS